MIAAIEPLVEPNLFCKETSLRATGSHTVPSAQAVAELAKERHRFDEILNTVPAMIFENWVGADGARHSFASEYVTEIFGYTVEEWLSTVDFWFTVVHPDDAERVAFESAEVFAGGREHSKLISRWLHKSGRVVWGDTHLVAVRNEAGRVCGVRGATFDITDRIRTDDELRWKTAFLEAQTHANLDAILVVDRQGATLFHNRKMIEVWQLPQELIERQDDAAMLQYALSVVASPDEFLRRVEHLYTHPHEIGRDEIKLKDGRVLDRYSSPVLGEDGTYYGRIWTFRDITDRKRAEADAQALNRQLFNLSREAGMAEVASNVLHNVGNVLNSVNVSLGLATEKVNRLKAPTLGRVATLLEEHAQNLPAFLAEHPQGSLLPHFLGQLAGHFAAEQQALLRELASLQKNLEHINDIVAMQQHYATAGGLMEVLPLAEVVEDALRMNAAACERHGTRVVCEWDPVIPPIPLDRNKVLLILVNLIRNAKYACDESGRKDKRITVRTELNGADKVTISVSDNGVGIPAENLPRIFEHGFTTRKNGHGFGLHSSALAAQDMGGSLTVSSAGSGRGATFTIELPVAAKSL